MKKFFTLCVFMTCCAAAWSQTFTVDTVLNNGNKSNRINLVVLADGYTASQQLQFNTDVTNLVNQFFATPPLSNYKSFFNVYAVHVISSQSGAKHAGTASDCNLANPLVPVSTNNTYFKATFDYGGTHRLLYCTNTGAIAQVLNTNTPWYDKAMILVNSPHYGGSGGTYPTASTHSSSAEIMIHEFGHSFAGLADEYGGSYCTGVEKPNVTQQTNPSLIKWKDWIGTGVPIPTAANTNCGDEGLYSGANYCNSGWYRPACDCKMRTLSVPFCAVCKQEYVTKTYGYVNPIDAYSPSSLSLTLNSGTQTFAANVLQPTTNTVKRQWKLDGTVVANKVSSYTVNANNLSAGTHTLVLSATDTTSFSKNTLPTSTVTWTITKSSGGIIATLATLPSVCANASAFTLTGGLPLGGLFSGPGVTNGVFNPAATGAGTFSITYSVLGVSVSQNIVVKAVPVISGSSSASFCTGSSATLSVSGASSYSWTPSNGLNVTTGYNVVAAPSSTTNYVVTGTSNGCSATKAISVTVNAKPNVTTSGSASVCGGTAAPLSASGANTYSWSPSTGLNTTTGSNVNAIPGSSTTYTVTGTAGNGCTATGTVAVSVNALNITTTGNTFICTGSTTTLSAAGGTSYSWSPSTGLNTTNGSSVMASPTSNTTYTVTASNGTCTATKTIAITVAATPTLTTSPNASVCNGAGATMTVSGANTYTWAPSTGLNATTGSNVTATPASTTTYTVTGNGAGCSSSKQIVVSVASNFNLSLNNTSFAVCNGTPAVITASGATSYSWAPSTALNNTNSSSVTASASSNITYTVTGTKNGCSKTATVAVSVSNLALSISATDIGICSGGSLPLTAYGGGTYNWSPSAGLNSTNGTTVIASPTVTTTYTVTSTLNGCTGTMSKVITVTPQFTLTSSSNTSICPGASASLSASGGATFSWSPMSGLNNSTSSSVIASPASTTTYTITATTGYCSKTKTVKVTVKQKPTLSVTTTPASCSGAANGAANLSVSGVTGTLTYGWSNGANSQDLNNVAAGNYSVTVNLTGGCSNSTNAYIGGGSCAAPVTYFTQNVTANSALLKWVKIPCAVAYRVRYKPSTASSWISVLTYDTSIAVSALSPGVVYQYQVQSYCNAALSDSSGYGVQQTFNTTSSGSCTAPTGLSTTFITGATAKLNWNAVPGAWGYKVRIRKSNNSNAWVEFTVQSPNASYNVTGLSNGTAYKWQVMTLCNAGGSSSSYGSLLYFNTFSSREDEDAAATVTDQELTTNINVYPNPVESQLNMVVEQNFEGDATLELYSITGQLIRKEDMTIAVGTTSVSWSVDDLTAGTYLLTLRQANAVETRRIVKQ